MMESKHAADDDKDGNAVNVAVGALTTAPLEAAVERVSATSLNAFLAQIEHRAFRLAEMQLRQREDAMDAVQDAMLRLAQHYRDKPPEEWAPLFWGILRRRIVDLQRRRKVRSIVVGWFGGGQDGNGDELPAWDPADQGPGPLDLLGDAQAYAAMSAAVRKLPRRQREAFMFRILEGLDVADTARAMHCSQGSVKTHLSRAMQHLREQLEDWR
jgi:RNA polymerase sigma-70 factor (ECF subfamily)